MKWTEGGTGFTMLTHAEQAVPRQFPHGTLLQNVAQACSIKLKKEM